MRAVVDNRRVRPYYWGMATTNELVTATTNTAERSAEGASFWAREAPEQHARKLAAERTYALQQGQLSDLSDLVDFRL